MKKIKAGLSKFCIEVPRGVKDALRLDEENGDGKWMETITKERDQLFEYDTFNMLELGVSAS